jgi:hypothetical protein
MKCQALLLGVAEDSFPALPALEESPNFTRMTLRPALLSCLAAACMGAETRAPWSGSRVRGSPQERVCPEWHGIKAVGRRKRA